MTIQEAIVKCDELKPNQYNHAQKVAWLDEIEKKIWNEVIEKRKKDEIEVENENENGEIVVEKQPVLTYNGYSERTPTDTKLLADMYSELYIYFLMSKIDFYNGETQRYNISAAQFNQAYQGFVDGYYRTHPQIGAAAPKNI